VDSDIHRECFTRHGLHLNKYGKERLSKLIAAQIYKLVGDNSKNALMIPLKWETEPLRKQNPTNPLPEQIVTCTIDPNKLKDSGTLTVEALNNRECKRNRRLPITRSDDFYGQQLKGNGGM